MKYGFGVDIGGTTVKLGLFTEKGELLEKWEIPTNTENQGAAILPDVAQAVEACLARRGLSIFSFSCYTEFVCRSSPFFINF